MNIISEIEKLDIGRVEANVSLSKYTTYRVGGIALAMVYPKSVKKLISLVKLLNGSKIKYKVIGNGSNLLFSDKNFDGVIIKLAELTNIKFLSYNKIRVEAGYSLPKLSLLVAKKVLLD